MKNMFLSLFVGVCFTSFAFADDCGCRRTPVRTVAASVAAKAECAVCEVKEKAKRVASLPVRVVKSVKARKCCCVQVCCPAAAAAAAAAPAPAAAASPSDKAPVVPAAPAVPKTNTILPSIKEVQVENNYI